MKMSKQQLIAISTFITLGLTLPLTSQAAIKCWTNKEGVRECGNAIPPEYAQQKSETIDNRGLTVDVQERAKSKEEIEAERQRQAEEERRKKEEEKRREEQARHDRVLLSTFLSEKDIIDSRDRKLSAIEANIELNRITIEKLKEKLDEEHSRAERYQKQNKEVPENLQQAIDSLDSQIEDKQQYITSKEEEMKKLKEKYDRDLKRFRELKGSGN